MAFHSSRLFNKLKYPSTNFSDLKHLICSLIGIYAYYYFFHFSEYWGNAVSVGLWLFELLRTVFLGLFALNSIGYFPLTLIWIGGYVISFVLAIPEIPQKIKNEAKIFKRAFSRRGFGIYTLFGGLKFYVFLRLRVIAYLLLFIFVSSSGIYFYHKYKNFETIYWKVKVYHHSRPTEFILKPNVNYTFHVYGTLKELVVNGTSFITDYKNKNIYPEAIVLNSFVPRIFNVTFPDTTSFYLIPNTEMVINDIESVDYEVWAYKKDGIEIPYVCFNPEIYLTNIKKEKSSKKKLK
jgi:hypothetical protein